MAKILIMNTKLKKLLDVQRENRVISSAKYFQIYGSALPFINDRLKPKNQASNIADGITKSKLDENNSMIPALLTLKRRRRWAKIRTFVGCIRLIESL